MKGNVGKRTVKGKMGKKTMKGKVGKSTTVISDLPEAVLHLILSHLPLEDSVRTSVLSKQWNSARKSNPFLDFKQSKDIEVEEIPEPQFEEWLREFLNFVDRTLKHFHQNKLCIERLHLKVFDINEDLLFPLGNTWLQLALHNGVSDLDFFAFSQGSLFPVSESTFAVGSSVVRDSFKFLRLKRLTMHMVALTENVVRDIIRNCPNISHLSLEQIMGLETLNISKLDKLVSLDVSTDYNKFESVYVNALSLEEVSFCCSGDVYDLTSCRNLRKIEIGCIGITDAQFHHCISQVPLLEVLNITNCHGLQRITMSLQRLKHLQIYSCQMIKAIEIDVPILSSLEFKPSSQSVLISVSSKVIRCSMYLSYSMQYRHSSWSLKCREYLGVPFKGVTFPSSKDSIKFTFVPDLSREVAKTAYLDLTGYRIVGSFHWVTLLDTLLSSCYPNIVSMTVDSSDEDNRVNIFRRMLEQIECRFCCDSPHCKCWRRNFKGAKIKSINGINLKNIGIVDHKQFLRVLDTFLSFPVGSEVQFELNWDHSEYITLPEESRTSFAVSSE